MPHHTIDSQESDRRPALSAGGRASGTFSLGRCILPAAHPGEVEGDRECSDRRSLLCRVQ